MDCSLVLVETQEPPVRVEQECDALLPGPPRPPHARSPDWVWTYLHYNIHIRWMWEIRYFLVTQIGNSCIQKDSQKLAINNLSIHALRRAGREVCTQLC